MSIQSFAKRNCGPAPTSRLSVLVGRFLLEKKCLAQICRWFHVYEHVVETVHLGFQGLLDAVADVVHLANGERCTGMAVEDDGEAGRGS